MAGRAPWLALLALLLLWPAVKAVLIAWNGYADANEMLRARRSARRTHLIVSTVIFLSCLRAW